jgi:hypothetical protein
MHTRNNAHEKYCHTLPTHHLKPVSLVEKIMVNSVKRTPIVCVYALCSSIISDRKVARGLCQGRVE